MCVIKKNIGRIFSVILFFCVFSCEEMDVCDSIDEMNNPIFEVNFKELNENSPNKIDFSKLEVLKEGVLEEGSLKNPFSFQLDLIPSNLLEFRYKGKKIVQVKVFTKEHYVSFACGFRILYDRYEVLYKEDHFDIKEVDIDKDKVDKTKKISIDTNKDNRKNENKKTAPFKNKLVLDIFFDPNLF